MTYTAAFFIIALLLVFDAVFWGFLWRKKKKLLFSLRILEGTIKSSEGEIPPKFLDEVKHLSQIYKPGDIRISVIRHAGRLQLKFSGPVEEELEEKYQQAFALYVKN